MIQRSKKADDGEILSEEGSESGDDGGRRRRRLSQSDADSPAGTGGGDKDRKRKKPRFLLTLLIELCLWFVCYIFSNGPKHICQF